MKWLHHWKEGQRNELGLNVGFANGLRLVWLRRDHRCKVWYHYYVRFVHPRVWLQRWRGSRIITPIDVRYDRFTDEELADSRVPRRIVV